MVATTGANDQRSIQALTRDQPFTLPLKETFEAGAPLKVSVFRYNVAALIAQFPGFAGRDAAMIASVLNPQFGPEGPGAYASPSTIDDMMLSAEVTEASAADVEYAEVPFDPRVFTFHVPAVYACPPGQGALRVFNRDDVGRVCVLQRTETCAWDGESRCGYFADLFGRGAEQDLEAREVPPNILRLEPRGVDCTEVHDAINGESRTYTCPNGQGDVHISIQNTARGKDGVPWLPDVKSGLPQLQGSKPVFTRGAKGAVYGILKSGTMRFERLFAVENDTIQQEPIQVLISTGVSDDVSVINPGEVQGVSADLTGDHLVASTSRVPAVIDRDTALPDDLAFYRDPLEVMESILPAARRVGPAVSARAAGTLYAVIDTGVAVVHTGGMQSATLTPAGTVTFTAAEQPKIAAVRKSSADRIVVWTNAGRLFVFDQNASPVITDCNLHDVLAAIDGPRVFRREAPEKRFEVELIDLSGAEGGGACDASATTYYVPPNDQNANGDRLQIDSLTYFVSGDRESIAYRYGDSGGVLDIASGLSSAAHFDITPAVSVLFPAPGNNRFWALFATDTDDLMRGYLMPVFEGP